MFWRGRFLSSALALSRMALVFLDTTGQYPRRYPKEQLENQKVQELGVRFWAGGSGIGDFYPLGSPSRRCEVCEIARGISDVS